MTEVFIATSEVPPFCVSFEERWTWLQVHIHVRLGFKRGDTRIRYDDVRKGWIVNGPKRGESQMPARGAGGRFIKKADS